MSKGRTGYGTAEPFFLRRQTGRHREAQAQAGRQAAGARSPLSGLSLLNKLKASRKKVSRGKAQPDAPQIAEGEEKDLSGLHAPNSRVELKMELSFLLTPLSFSVGLG